MTYTLYKLLMGLLLFTLTMPATAQELEARVTINHQQVQGTSTSVFENLKTTLEEFINERAWTNLQYRRNERIRCNFNITVKGYSPSDNSFDCTLYVQASRPVYNANYTTTTFAFNDPNFTFNYQEYDQIEFRSDVIDNNLTALVAYYVYLIIGMDLDSMSPLGGTEAFRQAQTIVTNAQSMPGKGWKAFEDNKNRYAVITDLLDGGMEPFRKMQYVYYRDGLDTMAENVERGRKSVSKAFELLKQARENKSMSRLPEIFTEYKRDEILSIYKGHGTAEEKSAVEEILSQINPSQNSYWREIKQ